MTESSAKSDRGLVIGVVVVLLIAAGAGIGYWRFGLGVKDEPLPPDEDGVGVVSEEVVSDFYKSLAALDVGENELAAEVLEHAVSTEPQEPALWANLAVAQLRLRELNKAQDSLKRASQLAEDSRELALLRAEVLEHAGDVEAAIEQLRKVHADWPENVQATFSLATLLGQLRTEEANAERLTLLADILNRKPENVRARCELARGAASLQREEPLRTTLDGLLADVDQWPADTGALLEQADQAARAGDFRQAALALTRFENVLKPEPAYQQSQAQLGVLPGGEIGTPLRSFLKLKLPAVEAADADVKLTFELRDIPETAARPGLVLAVELPGERGSTLLSLSGETLRVGESAALPLTGSSTDATPASVATVDLNFDFLQDLVVAGPAGCEIFLGQADGSFQAHPPELDDLRQPWKSVWAFDVEADGDLDLLLSDQETSLRWIRNNGDMTFSIVQDFIPAKAVQSLQAADFDGDGAVDLATKDAAGVVQVWRNERSGRFEGPESPTGGARLAMTTGDVDRDGVLELISISSGGELFSSTRQPDGEWSETSLVSWPSSAWPQNVPAGGVFLATADVDNNGAGDLIASAGFQTAIWLRKADGKWESLKDTPPLRVTSLSDRNNDGLLDLVGMTETGAQIAVNQSRAGYGWHVIQPRALSAAGDKRINSFGIGGKIEIRAGNLVQSAAIDSPRVHFGLGNRKQVDVARIVWPNGTFQAEFDLKAGEEFVANQRLSGSCPWLFAFDGREFTFVKDFIWRSPLGMRINAQTTAGVLQTEDWIKVPGSRLAVVDGRYQLRITAELWETHFFDHVRLMAVDHPAEAEIFVDERFVPNEVPALQIHVATPPEPLQSVVNHKGNPLDDVLASADGVYADEFALGEYQGVAEEHGVEFDIPDAVDAERSVLLVGHGWVYPTNSSLNVALSQGNAAKPFGLMLEQQGASGGWQVVRDNLGFPAGKNKDVVLELPEGSLSTSRRFRLRTNMEIYWDSLGWSYALPEIEPHIATQPAAKAELRERGYSRLKPIDRRRPDTPVYEVIATEQRWPDLEGYYTRFGDVHELLAEIDDRYVIMNAGDELVFEFRADGGPPDGWVRDFVLVGDGWVKDGDYNTAFSRWVRPLPAHGDADYAGPLLPLADDPVYQQHPDDWQTYHTRYVTPRRFHERLRRAHDDSRIRENQP